MLTKKKKLYHFQSSFFFSSDQQQPTTIKICNKEENFVSLKKINCNSIVYRKGLDLNIGFMVTICFVLSLLKDILLLKIKP